MPLLPDDDLEFSPTVANCRMNRERNLYGSNGYQRDIRIDPLAFLKNVVQQQGQASWLDLCCGTATALAEAGEMIDREQLPMQIVGVDLVARFVRSESPSLTLHTANLNSWQPDSRFDLITCVHGLHYIGDKLDLICRCASWLNKGGQFIANLDMANVRLAGSQSSSRIIASALRQAGFEYSFRQKLLSCHGYNECKCGSLACPLHLKIRDRLCFRYLGADDQAGPNYTGQPAVDSWYTRDR